MHAIDSYNKDRRLRESETHNSSRSPKDPRQPSIDDLEPSTELNDRLLQFKMHVARRDELPVVKWSQRRPGRPRGRLGRRRALGGEGERVRGRVRDGRGSDEGKRWTVGWVKVLVKGTRCRRRGSGVTGAVGELGHRG